MTDELKPVRCGCGGRPIIEYGEDGICRVRCSFCLTGTVYHRNKDQAITAWNKAMGYTEKSSTVERTTKAKVNFKDENFFFGWCECGQYQSSQHPYCPACGCRLIWGEDDE